MDMVETSQKYTLAPNVSVDEPRVEAFYGQLLRGMVHKLNNQLAVMHGFTSLLQMNDALDTGDQENLAHMKEAASSASSLSERVLAAGGCAKVSAQEVDIGELLKMIDSNLREPFAQAGIPFEIQAEGNLPTLMADSSRLKDVIGELLQNAADAASLTDGAAVLKVQPAGEFADPQSGRIDFIVRNTGETIPEEKLETIFEPFYSTRTSDHFGVGLTMASMLCEAMDIPLGVRSADGETMFAISVPVA